MENKYSFSKDEINLFKIWFNAVQDLNPKYLETKDYILAQKIHNIIGIRTPKSILRKTNSNEK